MEAALSVAECLLLYLILLALAGIGTEVRRLRERIDDMDEM